MAIPKAKREKKQLAIGIRQLAKSKQKREQATGNRSQSEKAKSESRAKQPQPGAAVPHEKTKQSTKPHTFTLPRRQVFNFPQAKGRVVREIEFSIDDDYKCLEFRFQDDTTLSFEFKPSFVWEAYFARWKSGEQSILHRWPLRKG